MKKIIVAVTLLLVFIMICYIPIHLKQSPQQNPIPTLAQKSILEGILVEHPKYFLKYYIQDESTEHACAILHTELIKDILPGSYIRAIGDIKSILNYEGYHNNIANYSASWIYMDIDEITMLRPPENTQSQTDTPDSTINSLNQLTIIQMGLTGDIGNRRISDLVKLEDVNNVIILNNGTSAPSEMHLHTIESIIRKNPEIQSFYSIDPDNGYRTRSYESEIQGFFTVLLQTESDCIGFDLGRDKIRIFNGIGDGWVER